MTWTELFRDLEALEGGLEQKPAENSSLRHFARLELANTLAHAREILEALSADEEDQRR